MAAPLEFRIVNVFTEGDERFSGNPLCVFGDATGLTTAEMQGLARQLNLSETTFVTRLGEPGLGATAAVRIFTSGYEMPFAGHPTLGTAFVVRELLGGGDALVLRMPVGDIPVRADGARWTLTARLAAVEPVAASREVLAAMLGLPAAAVSEEPRWVDAGSRQLVVPLRSVAEVRAVRVEAAALRAQASRGDGEALVYVWAAAGDDEIEARFFFTQDGAAIEDPATGSACANLGGWLHARGARGVRRRVRQGAAVARPSILYLEVDAVGAIRVGGDVREVARGAFRL